MLERRPSINECVYAVEQLGRSEPEIDFEKVFAFDECQGDANSIMIMTDFVRLGPPHNKK